VFEQVPSGALRLGAAAFQQHFNRFSVLLILYRFFVRDKIFSYLTPVKARGFVLCYSWRALETQAKCRRRA